MAATISPSVENTGAAMRSRPTASSSNVRAKPPSEAVRRRPRISFDERVPFQGAEEAQGRRAMHAKLARHLSARTRTVLGEQIEERDSPVDRADHTGLPVVVAHCATLHDSGILVGL